MTLTAAEQYLLELINRARLDPLAEANRLGIDLNQGLAPGTLLPVARQVLAPNALLEDAATAHSLWMLEADIFSHTGAGGSSPGTRATAAGYVWNRVGENIGWRGTSGTMNLDAAIAGHHDSLFNSAGHRQNMLSADYREMGIGQEGGTFLSNGTQWNASMLTELFGTSGTARFVTGVAFADRNGDGFYSIGEGQGGVTFAAAGQNATSAAAGGYSVTIGAASFSTGLLVTGTAQGTAFQVRLDLTQGNAKLDVVNGRQFLSSVTTELVSGIADLRLLGVAALDARGNAAANAITGNAGANTLTGAGGRDRLTGQDGNDRLLGGAGQDSLLGGGGNDTLNGGAGNDTLNGGAGTDRLVGGAGADLFQFRAGNGNDKVRDFQPGQDRISLDPAAWTGTLSAAEVVDQFARVTGSGVLFDFGGGDRLLLAGLTNTSGLAGWIDIA